MKAAICIITSNRLKLLLRLLFSLKNQVTTKDLIVIVENGSQSLTKQTISTLKKKYGFSKTNLTIKHLKSASIPRSRNVALKIANNNQADIAIFVDDDCVVSRSWLAAFKSKVRKHPKVNLFQGSVISIPEKNVFASATGSFYQSWLKANLQENHKVTLADTKNLALRLNKPLKKASVFNESQTFASDLEMVYRLKEKLQLPILVKDAVVKHQERANFKAFVKHRIRLSLAFNQVRSKYSSQTSSAKLLLKLKNLYKDTSHYNQLQKIKLWLALAIVFVVVFTVKLLKKNSALFSQKHL